MCFFPKAFQVTLTGILIWEIPTLMSPSLITEEITVCHDAQHVDITELIDSVLG